MRAGAGAGAGGGGGQNRRCHEAVVEDQIGLPQTFDGAQGQQVGRPRPCPDKSAVALPGGEVRIMGSHSAASRGGVWRAIGAAIPGRRDLQPVSARKATPMASTVTRP